MFAVAAGPAFAACWNIVKYRLPILLLTGMLSACGPKTPDAETPSASPTPVNTALLFEGALEDFQRNDLEKAEKKLDAIEKAGDVSPIVFNMLGAVWTKKKDYAKANEYFNRALEMDPTFFPALFNRGEVLFLEKKYPEALDYFSQLQLSARDYDLLLFKIYLCHLLLNDPESAQAMLDRIKNHSNSPAWYYAQAAWEITNNQQGKAKKYLKNAKVLFPEKIQIFEDTFTDLGWPTH